MGVQILQRTWVSLFQPPGEWSDMPRKGRIYGHEGASVVDGGFLSYLIHELRFGIAGAGIVEGHGGEGKTHSEAEIGKKVIVNAVKSY